MPDKILEIPVYDYSRADIRAALDGMLLSTRPLSPETPKEKPSKKAGFPFWLLAVAGFLLDSK